MASLLRMTMTGPVRSWAAATADARNDQEMRSAVAFFRTRLGEDWSGWQDGAPLACVYATSFQEGPREWVRLHRLLTTLDGEPHLDQLVRRGLGSARWNEYVAAVETLEFCARFRRGGCAVALIQNDHLKSPDASVALSGRPVTIEFKALHEQDRQKSWNEFNEVLFNALCQLGTDFSGLDVEYTDRALLDPTAVASVLASIKSEHAEDFRDLPDGAGRARFVAAFGNRGSLRPPFEQKGDFTRLVQKLRSKWWRQLDAAVGPTLIVVRATNVFCAHPQHVLARAAELAASLSDDLARKRMVGGVLIYEEPLAPPFAPLTQIDSAFRLSMGESEGGHARISYLVPNPVARVPLADEELDVLVGPAMRW